MQNSIMLNTFLHDGDDDDDDDDDSYKTMDVQDAT